MPLTFGSLWHRQPFRVGATRRDGQSFPCISWRRSATLLDSLIAVGEWGLFTVFLYFAQVCIQMTDSDMVSSQQTYCIAFLLT